MKIGIDISQLAYQGTGVANYLGSLVEALLENDTKNEYVLFYSSMRKQLPSSKFWDVNSRFLVKEDGMQAKGLHLALFKLPPILLDILWNKLHILPIEQFIGDVDVFISSDWTQPPTKKAKKATILYDLIVYKYPEETHNKWTFSFKNLLISPNIVASQKRRLDWVKKECEAILCISESTKKDAMDILGISGNKLFVTYPGI